MKIIINFNKNITSEQVLKITGKATIGFNNENNSFLFFYNLNAASARHSGKKLREANYDAEVSRFDNKLIIVQKY